jgi:VanZ family protein
MSRTHIGLLAVLTAYAAQIVALYIAVQPGQPYELHFPGEDKLIHAGGFALMGLLLMAGAMLAGRGWWYFTGVFSGFLLGALTEILQIWVRGRKATVWDWVANFVGLLVVIGLYEFLHLWRRGGIIHREVT